MPLEALCIISKASVNSNCGYSPETPSLGKNQRFFRRVTSKFERWPWKTTGYLFLPTSSFVHHFVAIGKFKLELQSGDAQYGSKSAVFLSRGTLKFDRCPWKTIEPLFYATWSFVHQFIAICEFKLELQSSNAQFGSKSAILCPVWRWNLIDDLEKQQSTSSMLLQALCIIS